MWQFGLVVLGIGITLACQPRRAEVEDPDAGQAPYDQTPGAKPRAEAALPDAALGKSPYRDDQGRDIPIFIRGEFNDWLNDGRTDLELASHPARMALQEASGCLSTAVVIPGRTTPQNFKLGDLRQQRTLPTGETVVGWEFVDIGSPQRGAGGDFPLDRVSAVQVSYSPRATDFLGGNPNLRAIFASSGLYRFELCPSNEALAQATLLIRKEAELSGDVPAVYQPFLRDRVYVRGFGRRNWALMPDWELLFNSGNGCYERTLTIPATDENNNPAELRHFKIASADWVREIYGARSASQQLVSTATPLPLDSGPSNMNLILQGTDIGPYQFRLCREPNGSSFNLHLSRTTPVR